MCDFFSGEATHENLGFRKIWDSLHISSAAGRRVKARQSPKLPGQEKELEYELETLLEITKIWDQHPESFSRIINILESLKDPFQTISSLEDGKTLSPADLFILAHLAFCVSKVLSEIKATSSGREDEPFWPWPREVVPPDLSDVEKILLPGFSGQPTFYISDSYSPELAKVRLERKNKEKAWRAEMTREAEICEKVLGKRPGLREEIAIRRSNAELIEKARLMPELGETRETLTHVHFRLKATKEAVKLEREISRLRQKEVSLEEEVLLQISRNLKPAAPRLESAAWAMGRLDFMIARCRLAREWKAEKPVINPPGRNILILEEATHPLISEEVRSRGGTYQPISITSDSVVSVITGPNMGGKTATLATIGLMVSLAQWGFLVPCKHMVFSLYDFVYFQPAQAEKPGLSSFASEIVALQEPLLRVEGRPAAQGKAQGEDVGLQGRGPERGLILLDEIGRGTNPSQGLSLYAAVLAHFMEKDQRGSTVIATTHYHGLSAMLGVPHWQVTGLVPSMDDLQDQDGRRSNGARDINWLYQHMDYRLTRVGPDTPIPHDAILVAKLLGLDYEVIKKAEDFYKKREKEANSFLC